MPKDERSELGSNTDMQPALAFSQEPFKIATGVLQGMKDPFNAFAYRVEQAVKFRRVLLVLVGAFLRPNAISRERPDVCLPSSANKAFVSPNIDVLYPLQNRVGSESVIGGGRHEVIQQGQAIQRTE